MAERAPEQAPDQAPEQALGHAAGRAVGRVAGQRPTRDRDDDPASSQDQAAAGTARSAALRRTPRTPWAWAVGTFFGTGFLKPAPGTWGSVAAMLLWLLFLGLVHPSPPALRGATLLAALLALVTGIPAATLVEAESSQDPGHVVIDEVAGQWIALLAFCGYGHANWPHALLALGLFRLFDITKPWPARQLEHLHGGLGIMLDDVAAGVYALVVGVLIGHWW